MNRLQVFAVAAGFLAVSASAQQRVKQESVSAIARDVDPAIAKVIAETRAFDNHAHPVLSPPEDATDRGFDALPVDNMEPETDPSGWRPDSLMLHDAWLALYGFDAKAPLKPEEEKKLNVARAKVKAREAEHYSQWVLDKAGIGIMAANRVMMGTGVKPPRFLWVPFDDALLFPLDNSAMADTPDRVQFFALEEKLRQQYFAAENVKAPPATLDEYVRTVLIPTLTKQKQGGAIAVKFELAYLRSLSVAKVSHEEAAAVYSKYAQKGVPSAAEYKLLQDYLLRTLIKRCGELGMVVHFHGMAGGGRYFSIAGVNPLNLEPLINDPSLSGTNIVLLHGGWPFVHEAGAMLQKPNFYLDLSQQAILIPARTLSAWLREWLELYPDKVLFATDGYPLSPSMGWEESTWLASRNARQALGLALTGMERDGEITPRRAAEIARMVLSGNAEALYKLRIDDPR
jgi:predicted TIM-barrel fold metal-dependent hydrolase